jgi:hypothetical protein
VTRDALLSPAHHQVIGLLHRDRGESTRPADRWHRIGSAVLVDADALDHAFRVVARLCALVDRLADLVFDGNRQRLHRFHGIPERLDTVLSAERQPARRYARPDCVLAGGRLRMLELNIGTGTLDITASMASMIYLAGSAAWRRAQRAVGERWQLTQWSADQVLAQALGELGDGAPVGLWYHDTAPDVRRMIEDVCAAVEAHGVQAVPVHTDDVDNSNLPLFANFSSIHLLGPEGAGLAHTIRRRLQPTAPGTLVQPGDLVRTAKANLALLHRMVRAGKLTDEDADAVLEHVPETVSIDRSTDIRPLLRTKDDWVVKPNLSFQGRGVLFGRNLTAADWEAALRRGHGQVVQRVLDSDPVPVLVRDAAGARVEHDGRLVFMPHVVDGRPAGVSVRYSTSRDVLGRIDFGAVYSTLCVAARPRPIVAEAS